MKKIVGMLLLFCMSEATAQAPTEGLVAHYTLNNSAADQSGKNNNGQIKGGVTAAEDRFHNPTGAMRFNGKDGYITVPNSLSLQSLTSSITVAAWVKVEKGTSAANDIRITLVSKSGSDNPAGSKAQFRFLFKRVFGESRSEISLTSDFAGQDNAYNSHPIEFDKWHFIAFTYEENFFYVYRDGELIWQGMNPKPFVPNDLALEIGRDVTNGNNYFSGCLDDLRIYRYALSLSEIQMLYEDAAIKAPKVDFTFSPSKNIETTTQPGKCFAVVNFAEPSTISGAGKTELQQIKGLKSGSEFPVGITSIVYEGATPTGEKLIDSFTVTVADKEAPVFTCNSDINIKAAPGDNTVVVNFTNPAVTDNCSNLKVEIKAGLPPGSAFPVGVSLVRYIATDASGNKAECSFQVTVTEDVVVKPVPHCTGDIVAYTKADSRSAKVTYTEPYVEISGNKVSMKLMKGGVSGSDFAVGKTEVIYEAEDHTACSFTVTVKDTIAPAVVCPPDINRMAEAGDNTLKVNYSLPKAMDGGAEIPVRLVKGLSSGSDFPIGRTNILYEAVDEAGNKSECSFAVMVGAVAARPVPHCSENITAYTKGNRTTVAVTYQEPYTEAKGEVALMKKISGPASGAEFPIGKTEITYVSADNFTCKFTVTVKDTVPPGVLCPSAVTQTCEYGQKSVVVNYTVPKPIETGGEVSVKLISGLSSGSSFPVGSTSVVYEATDKSGNKMLCSFVVTVKEKEPVKVAEPPVVKQAEVNPAETKPLTATEQKKAEAEKVFAPDAAPTVKKEAEVKAVPVPPVKAEEKKVEVKKEEPVKPVVKEEPVAEVKPVPPAKTEEKPVEVKKIEPPVETVLKEKPVVEEKMTEPVVVPIEKKKPEIAKPAKSSKALAMSCTADVMKQNDPGKCGAVVNYPVPLVTGGTEPKLMQTKGIQNNHYFAVGTTENTYLAKDAGNYLQECSFNVTVKDLEPPVFQCPDDTIIILPAGRRGVIYFFNEPKVRDNCQLDSMIQVAGSKTGCFLQVGVHPFIYKAIDKYGNYQMCTHSVMVKEDTKIVIPEPPKKLDAQAELGGDSVHYEHKAEVKDCYLTVVIYDDGEEDNDTVSIIFNGQVIVNKSMIRVKENGTIVRNLVLDGGDKNYLIAKAWNKGRVGLNTLKVEIYEGNFEDNPRELRTKKPVIVKVLHSKPGIAGGMLLNCSE